MPPAHSLPMFLVPALTLALIGCGDDPGTRDDAGTTTAVSGIDPSIVSTHPTASESSSGSASEGESTTTDTTAADDSASDPSADTTTDTSGTTEPGSTTEPMKECQVPDKIQPCDEDSTDVFKAMGLNCSDDPITAVPISNPVFDAPDKSSYRVATRLGIAQSYADPALPAWGPKHGYRFLMIGTGTFPPTNPDGSVIEPNDADSDPNGNPDEITELPGVMRSQPGSNHGKGGNPYVDCDGVNDCSDSLGTQWNTEPKSVANDLFYMSFDVTAPPGVHGYKLDFLLFSEEYPTFVGSEDNDLFIVWSTSETFTGNVTTIEEQPLTVTSLADYMIFQPWETILTGTGFFGDMEGGSTGWITIEASAQPGETFTVAISLFDVGDTVWDTVVMLDKFRWDCQGCTPGKIGYGSCGLDPR